MQCVYEFLSIHFKAHKFASSQTNDINVSILGLYFLDQCFNPGKKFYKFIFAFIFRKNKLNNLVRFPSSVQETKTSKFSSRIVVVRLLRTVKLHNQTISFYNCPSRTLKVFLHLHATRSLFQESKRIISSSLRRH